jgi:hypothetical protein
MTSKTIVPAFSAGVFFTALSAFGQIMIQPGASVLAPPSQFPPIGLAASETAQVNVANTATQSVGGTAPSCTGTITFYNASGAIIGAATSFTVGSGQIFSATLPYASTGAAGSRTVFRVAIALTSLVAQFGIQSSGPPPCALSSSLETYDTATGVTHLVIAGLAPTGVIRAVLSATAP